MSGYLKVNHQNLIALGEFIRNQRIKRDIGLREMSKKLEISSAYLSNLESGKHSMANPLLLLKISEILKIDHLKLYKIVGYTNKDFEEIQYEKKENKKIKKLLGALEKFSEDEFELLERYIALLNIKK
jgi:transcriptional regulator with XRE-family HTH domain